MRNIFDDFNIGEMVKKQLRIKKISQEQLSVMLGIPKTNTNRLLGNSSIDTDKLNKICEAIDYNFYAEICNGEGYKLWNLQDHTLATSLQNVWQKWELPNTSLPHIWEQNSHMSAHY